MLVELGVYFCTCPFLPPPCLSGWILKETVYEFPKEVKKDDTVPSEELVETAVSYARALDIII